MPRALFSSEEIAEALVAYSIEHGRIPKDAEVKNVTMHVEGWLSSKEHRASIDWEPAKEKEGR